LREGFRRSQFFFFSARLVRARAPFPPSPSPSRMRRRFSGGALAALSPPPSLGFSTSPSRALSTSPSTSPSPLPTSCARLTTIRVSNFNERARWGLDHHSVPFDERPFHPGLHPWGVLSALLTSSPSPSSPHHPSPSRGSTWAQTPLLVTPSGQRIQDSYEILRWADRHRGSASSSSLFHAREEVDRVSSTYEALGVAARRLAYSSLLDPRDPDSRALWVEMAEANVGPSQASVARLLSSRLADWVWRGTGADDPARVRRAREKVERLFDEAGDRLAHASGDFLVGGHFSAADISFSALAAPVLVVQPYEGFGAWLPPIDRLPDALQETVRHFRAHPAGMHALRMFRLHRGTRVRPGLPAVPSSAPPPAAADTKGRSRGGGLGPEVV
jgi:glutathione S-transferase